MYKRVEERFNMTNEDFINLLKDKYENGESITNISNELGISREVVRRRLKKAGVHIKKDTDSFNKNITKKQLKELYYYCELTLEEMLPYLGCKSTITASKILHKYGIDTNRNNRMSLPSKLNMSKEEFKDYLNNEYVWKLRSINSIAKELNVSHVIIAKYLNQYSIPIRSKSEQEAIQPSATYKGGIQHSHSGYLAVSIGYGKNKYYHRVIVEQYIGRKLQSDEMVHHIDCNKNNNDIHNLVVLSKSDHTKVHSLIRKGINYHDALKEVNIIWIYE